MSASQQFISNATPMGANLIGDGATFRAWAPGAEHVYVALGDADNYQPQPADELVKDPVSGHWTGFFPGVVDGAKYRFFVVGEGGSGLKRDPFARELELYGYQTAIASCGTSTHTRGMIRASVHRRSMT